MRNRLIAADITVHAAALAAGIPYGTFRRRLVDGDYFTMVELSAISRVLHVPVTDLIEDEVAA